MLRSTAWSFDWLKRIMLGSLLLGAFGGALSSALVAEEPKMPPPIQELGQLPVLPKAFEGGGKPAEIKSAEDALAVLSKEDAEKLAKQVDFKQQVVLLFAWRGSGRDKLNYAVLESFPEQIVFSRERGLTKDLRQHVKIFALRSNVRWSVK